MVFAKGFGTITGVALRHPEAAAARSLGSRRRVSACASSHMVKVFLPSMTNFLAMNFRCAYVPIAQIRTCLWPCVDR
jgi:hypothetical protein